MVAGRSFKVGDFHLRAFLSIYGKLTDTLLLGTFSFEDLNAAKFEANHKLFVIRT